MKLLAASRQQTSQDKRVVVYAIDVLLISTPFLLFIDWCYSRSLETILFKLIVREAGLCVALSVVLWVIHLRARLLGSQPCA